MSSIQYKVADRVLRALNVRDRLDCEGEDFDRLLARCSARQKKPVRVPYGILSANCTIERKVVKGVRCYVISPKGKTPDKAVLYPAGKDFIMPPDVSDMLLCGDIAQNTGAEVWMPLCPMAPEHTFTESVRAVFIVYRQILRNHEAPDVRLFGVTSGALLALSLCLYIKEEFPAVKLPGGLVLQSPVLQLPPTKDQMKEMTIRSKKDIVMPPGFLDNIAPVAGEGCDSYLLSPLMSDLAGLPPVDVFYGSDEIVITYLKYLQAACKRGGVKLRTHVSKGLVYNSGVTGFIPEARAVRQEYFEALKQ